MLQETKVQKILLLQSLFSPVLGTRHFLLYPESKPKIVSSATQQKFRAKKTVNGRQFKVRNSRCQLFTEAGSFLSVSFPVSPASSDFMLGTKEYRGKPLGQL